MAQEPEPAARALNLEVDNAARVKEEEGADAGKGGGKEASVWQEVSRKEDRGDKGIRE
jgi:hypothetical protein